MNEVLRLINMLSFQIKEKRYNDFFKKKKKNTRMINHVNHNDNFHHFIIKT